MRETLAFPDHVTFAEFLSAAESPKGLSILAQFEANFVSIADMAAHTTATGHGALVHLPDENVFFEHVSKPQLIGFAHHLVHDGIVV